MACKIKSELSALFLNVVLLKRKINLKLMLDSLKHLPVMFPFLKLHQNLWSGFSSLPLINCLKSKFHSRLSEKFEDKKFLCFGCLVVVKEKNKFTANA
jgi:hypothetical protein